MKLEQRVQQTLELYSPLVKVCCEETVLPPLVLALVVPPPPLAFTTVVEVPLTMVPELAARGKNTQQSDIGL